MTTQDLALDFHAADELEPGPTWQSWFDEFWPAYRRWFERATTSSRPRYAECLRALRTHMPEFVPVYERLTELAGGGDTAARFLSLYRPPPFLSGCSQAVFTGGPTALVRNYDYAPRLCDGIVLRSAWCGVRTIATTDCLIGALDGLNEHGLAVALAFGGRRSVGDGFGIPIVVRYVLETCADVPSAVAALTRIPVHMAYNVTLADRDGRQASVFVGPDRPARAQPIGMCTNHQEDVVWPEHAARTHTVEREEFLRSCLADSTLTLPDLVDRFLTPPLFRRDYARGSGTLYTLVLYPADGVAEYRWPDHGWRLSFERFPQRGYVAHYRETRALR
ncbi:MAG: hypothetical protein HKO59_01445 [Phycisphaerales bacterium]|nr:hypothetical protein [Phycisphaerae bacterium]NNF42621.1 hypothetical protein [Phycisphaerales bacterium]NNM24645.1 hypothetical protein [Phycisphaerales bacterium]